MIRDHIDPRRRPGVNTERADEEKHAYAPVFYGVTGACRRRVRRFCAGSKKRVADFNDNALNSVFFTNLVVIAMESLAWHFFFATGLGVMRKKFFNT